MNSSVDAPTRPDLAAAGTFQIGQVFAVLGVLIVIALISFYPTLRAPLTALDGPTVGNNFFLVGLEGLERAWRGIFPSPDLYPLSEYRPVTHTSLWIDFAISSRLLGDSTLSYHLTGVLLHAFNGALLFMLLKKLSVPGALLASILFVAHPLQTQAVAWVFARGYPLAMLFSLLATFPFLRWAGAITSAGVDQTNTVITPIARTATAQIFTLPEEPWKLIAIAFVLFMAAMLAHPAAICVPFAWLVIVWWKTAKLAPKVAIGAVAYLLPAVALVVLSVTMSLARADLNAGIDPGRYDLVEASNGGPPAEAVARLGVAGVALLKYTQLFFVPFDLMPDHPRFNVTGPIRIVGLLTLAGIAALTGWLATRSAKSPWSRHVLAVVLLVVVLLAPAALLLDFSPDTGGLFIERTAYFGVIALAVGTAAVFASIVRARADFAAPASGLAVLGVIALVGGSFWHAKKYQSEGPLWSFAASRNNSSLLALSQGADLRDRKGEDAQAVDRAILKRYPQEPYALLRIGQRLARKDDLPAAKIALEELVSQQPRFAKAQLALGEVLEASKDDAGAFTAYLAAVDADPRLIPARLRLTGSLMSSIAFASDNAEAIKRLEQARQVIEDTLKIQPLDPSVLLTYGKVVIEGGAADEALIAWEKARQISPFDPQIAPQIANNIGMLHLRVNQLEEAEKELQRALSIRPSFPEAITNLGTLRLRQNRPQEARALFQHALAIDANFKLAERRLRELGEVSILPLTRPATGAAAPSMDQPTTKPTTKPTTE